MNSPIDGGMGKGELEIDLTFSNVYTKWLLSESFTTEIVYIKSSMLEIHVVSWAIYVQ